MRLLLYTALMAYRIDAKGIHATDRKLNVITEA